jgi:glutathione S-transferase
LLTLFGTLNSGNVHKVQMIFGRIGETYRRVDVAQTRNEPRDEKYLAMNPMGKVPAVLREDGRVLSESGAILYYFAQSIPLWPKGVDEQTEVLRHFTDDPNPSSNRIAELEPKARHALMVLESQLSDKEWLAADRCTIADYALYPYTRTADSVGFEIAEYPGIERWLARVECQPGFIPLGSGAAVETLSFAEYFQP